MPGTENDVFIERPDEHEIGNEVYCWMPGSDDRECNGSCVAFDERSTQDPRVDTCKALNALRSLALSAGRFMKRAQSAAVQAEVGRLPDPPEVR